MNNNTQSTGWSHSDFKNWCHQQIIKRSYKDEVVSKILALKDHFQISQYATINYGNTNHPLYLIGSSQNDTSKPNILITGGVHGYETSGVHGALKFMQEEAPKFAGVFNFICAPCISPWAYETINRWNFQAIDPNRNFMINSPAKECSHIINAIKDLDFLAHFDLHETTDTDNTIFRPLLEKRDGIKQDLWEIPDGFYLVGDTSRPRNDFQTAIIESVEKVTHIAPADKAGKIISVETEAKGIINYDVKKLYLCAGMTDAEYVTTTEVYPDSPKVTDDECNLAQVAAISGGLDFLTNSVLNL